MPRATLSLSLLLCSLTILQPSFQKEYHIMSSSLLRSGDSLEPKNKAEAQRGYWMEEALRGIKMRVRRGDRQAGAAARNVVLFVGDGMSGPTVAAARALLGQRRGADGEEASLSFETFPTVGLAKTYCVDAQIADSACSATAYLTGNKNNLGTIGVSSNVSRCACAPPAADDVLASIAAWALEDGRDAGIVTTTRVTHASPAGAYAHVADRNWESDADVGRACAAPDRPADVARQLVHSFPGNRFKVIMGGGRREFLPNTVVDEKGNKGRRQDRRNLIEDWKYDKISRNLSHQYVWNREQLMLLALSPPEYLLGLFHDSHMNYNVFANPEIEPSLAEMTEVALRTLIKNDRGFFLFVEGGRIDHAHHENKAKIALDETIELSKAVARATELLSAEQSLVVVTADHAHAMTFNGYARRGRDVLGRSDQRAGVPYMTLSYANGPGARAPVNGLRADVTAEKNYGSTDWRWPAMVRLRSETHGGDDVAVFARGPQRAMFSGLYEQSQLPYLMGFAACLGPGPHVCDLQ